MANDLGQDGSPVQREPNKKKKRDCSNREFNRLLRKKYVCEKCGVTISEAFREQHNAACTGKMRKKQRKKNGAVGGRNNISYTGKMRKSQTKKRKYRALSGEESTDIFDKGWRMDGSFGNGKRR